ncbi:hypothetical protein JCM39194_09730 [Desulfotomaculum varum]
MTKRFIPRRDLVDLLDTETMRSFLMHVLQHIDDSQTHPYYNPKLDKLGHEVLKTAFEFGLVNLNGGCPGCGGCAADTQADKPKPDNTSEKGKIIPFKRQ